MKAFITALAALLIAAVPAQAKSKQERIDGIQKMRTETLAELYSVRPQVEDEIDGAAGYAVFSNVGVQVFLLGAGGGTGVAHDNASGLDTYMKMGTASVGLGLGVKDFRAVFVFHNKGDFDNFIENGWDFGGSADAAAQAGDVGEERGAASSVDRQVSIYQFTQNGLALQATLNGTKYWRDKKLNTYAAEQGR